PRMGRAGIIATVTGCIASGVGFLVYTIAFSLDAKSFADEAVHTSGAARDAVSGSAVQAATVIYQLGRFGLALALVIISLNAMRGRPRTPAIRVTRSRRARRRRRAPARASAAARAASSARRAAAG